jgi:hypothetical protein
MKKIIDPVCLASDYSSYNKCIYVQQSNYSALGEIGFYPFTTKPDYNKDCTVAVFKVRLKSSIPVMQVNKEGQLIALS